MLHEKCGIICNYIQLFTYNKIKMKNNATMFCPKCGSSLISGGEK